jgi:hypothetical protein
MATRIVLTMLFHVLPDKAMDSETRKMAGLPAQIVMADTAYDSDRLRNVIADKALWRCSPTILPAPKNTRWTSTSTPSAT